jgi:KaiC/GvpD/RAD55 family RecA-like ATPase
MLKQELIRRSPIRVLEKSIHGGLGKGNLGIFTARKGVGKTACLCHVSLDRLLDGQSVLHLSFADDPHHIETWYRQVFHEVAQAYKLDDAFDIYDEIAHRKLIIHFKQKDIDFNHIIETVDRIAGGASLEAETLIVDGLNFETMRKEEIADWKRLAENRGVEIWFSATLPVSDERPADRDIPESIRLFEDQLSVIIRLEPMPGYIKMELLKDHGSPDLEKLHLKLDPATLLISNHRV